MHSVSYESSSVIALTSDYAILHHRSSGPMSPCVQHHKNHHPPRTASTLQTDQKHIKMQPPKIFVSTILVIASITKGAPTTEFDRDSGPVACLGEAACRPGVHGSNAFSTTTVLRTGSKDTSSQGTEKEISSDTNASSRRSVRAANHRLDGRVETEDEAGDDGLSAYMRNGADVVVVKCLHGECVEMVNGEERRRWATAFVSIE